MKNCQERLRVYLLTLQELESSSENCLNAKRKNSKNKKRWISWKIKKIQIKGVMEPEMKESPRNYTQVRQIISVTLSYSTFWRAGDTNTSIKSTICELLIQMPLEILFFFQYYTKCGFTYIYIKTKETIEELVSIEAVGSVIHVLLWNLQCPRVF